MLANRTEIMEFILEMKRNNDSQMLKVNEDLELIQDGSGNADRKILELLKTAEELRKDI